MSKNQSTLPNCMRPPSAEIAGKTMLNRKISVTNSKKETLA